MVCLVSLDPLIKYMGILRLQNDKFRAHEWKVHCEHSTERDPNASGSGKSV